MCACNACARCTHPTERSKTGGVCGDIGGIASPQEFNQKEEICQRGAHTHCIRRRRATHADRHTTRVRDMNISRVHALVHSSGSLLMKRGNIVGRHVQAGVRRNKQIMRSTLPTLITALNLFPSTTDSLLLPLLFIRQDRPSLARDFLLHRPSLISYSVNFCCRVTDCSVTLCVQLCYLEAHLLYEREKKKGSQSGAGL